MEKEGWGGEDDALFGLLSQGRPAGTQAVLAPTAVPALRPGAAGRFREEGLGPLWIRPSPLRLPLHWARHPYLTVSLEHLACSLLASEDPGRRSAIKASPPLEATPPTRHLRTAASLCTALATPHQTVPA